MVAAAALSNVARNPDPRSNSSAERKTAGINRRSGSPRSGSSRASLTNAALATIAAVVPYLTNVDRRRRGRMAIRGFSRSQN